MTLAGGVAGAGARFVGLEVHALGLGSLLLVAATYLPLQFRLGAGRGLLWLSAIALVGLAVGTLVTPRILRATGLLGDADDPAAWAQLLRAAGDWVEPRLGWLTSLFVGAALLAALASLFLSRRLYAARDL